MPQISLSYFDLPISRGEECRLALVLADVDFEDDRIVHGAWPQRKSQTPFGAVPVLHVEGKGSISQSNAILIYIGTRFGLRPSDAFEAAHHDSIMESVEELRIKAWDALKSGTTDDEKKASRLAFAEGPLQAWASSVEGQLKGPFTCGAKLQVADIKLWSICHWFGSGVIDHVPTNILARHERLLNIHRLVSEDPKVAAFRAKHLKK